MRFAFSPAEERFRAEVVAFLAEWSELDGFFAQDRHWEQVRAFYRELGARNWLAVGWPEHAGGLGLGPASELLLWDEIAYRRIARPPLGAGIVAKTLIRHGTEAQRAAYLPGLRSGELHFSLGYSEPEAGSDLAGLRTRAERRGDAYVVRGEKCWTSYAQHADYLWLLARTGTPESRSDGLSLFALDLRAAGVSVAPIPTLDDEQLNEVHLDDVEVPVGARVGPENGAWKIMAQALADERHVQFPPARVRRDVEELAAWCHEQGLAGDARVQAVLADLAALAFEAEIHALRVLDAIVHGRAGVVEAAANKVAHTLACQRVSRAVMDLAGPAGLERGAPVERLWRQSTWETIGGGTSEVMRSVVARQALGLGGKR